MENKKEHPIIFSIEMVQAILEGKKTQTRRIIKQLPTDINNVYAFAEDGKHFWKQGVNGVSEFGFRCPYGKVGDTLWVRETCQHFNQEWSGNWIYVYKADYKNEEWKEWVTDEESEDPFKWRPSIHMPKEAARIFLEITNIRVERLQDISEQDAIAEGVQSNECSEEDRKSCPSSLCKEQCSGVGEWYDYESIDLPPTYSAVESFKTLWQKINGHESWELNQWVWVIEFKKITDNGK